MASYKNIGDIVTAGLKDAGNPGIQTRGVEFLIGLLNHMDLAYDWDFNQAEASISTSNVHEISLAGVTRYRNIAVLKLVNIKNDLPQVDYRDLWVRLQEAIDKDTRDIPYEFATVPDRSKLLVYPRPAAGVVYTGKILYYKQPDPTAYSSSSFPAFDDTLALEAAVATFAQRYDKEPMQIIVERVANDLWGRYRARHGDKGRNRPQQMKWGRAYGAMEPQE